MDRVFLDANILFATAYKARAGLRRLWQIPEIELVASTVVCLEAQRNLLEIGPDGHSHLPEQEQIEKLDRLLYLLRSVKVATQPPDHALPEGILLPEKDRPILLAALAVNATHLLTLDKTHFGPYFGQVVEGVLILPPGEYLQLRSGATDQGP